MKISFKHIFFCLGLLLFELNTSAQKRFTISGYLNDRSNGESLIGATVKVNEIKMGTATNTYGYYSLSLPQGKYTLVFSYLGFKTISVPIILDKNTIINQRMEVQINESKEVVITGEREDKNVRST